MIPQDDMQELLVKVMDSLELYGRSKDFGHYYHDIEHHLGLLDEVCYFIQMMAPAKDTDQDEDNYIPEEELEHEWV